MLEAEVAAAEWRRVTDEINALVARMPAERWDEPSSCGSWTNREVLAHLATGYVVRIEWIEAAIAGRAAVATADIDAVNERNVAAWRAAPVDAIVAEMLATRGRVLELLGQLEPRQLDLEFERDGLARPLGELLATFSAHDVEHVAQFGHAVA